MLFVNTQKIKIIAFYAEVCKYQFESNSTASFVTFTVKRKAIATSFLYNVKAKYDTALFDSNYLLFYAVVTGI